MALLIPRWVTHVVSRSSPDIIHDAASLSAPPTSQIVAHGMAGHANTRECEHKDASSLTATSKRR